MSKKIEFMLDGGRGVLKLEVKADTDIDDVREALKAKCAPKLDQFAAIDLKLYLTTDGNVAHNQPEMNPADSHSAITDKSIVVIHHPSYKTEGSDVAELRRDVDTMKRKLDHLPDSSKRSRTLCSFLSRTEVYEEVKVNLTVREAFWYEPDTALVEAIPPPTFKSNEKDGDENKVYHPKLESFVGELIKAAATQAAAEAAATEAAATEGAAATEAATKKKVKKAKVYMEAATKKYLSLHHTAKTSVLPAIHGGAGGEQPDCCIMEDDETPNTPVYVISVIDIKKVTKARSCWQVKDITQVLGYGQRVLINQPNRQWVDVALCDCKYIQFFQVRRAPHLDHPYLYRQSEMYHLKDLATQQHLLALLERTFEAYSFASPPSLVGMKTLAFKGKGSSSIVYEIMDEKTNEMYVLKAHKDEATVKVEMGTLTHLQDSLPTELRCYVPKVFSQHGMLIALLPLAKKLQKLTRSDLQIIVKVLKNAHSINLVHRDISPNNLLRQDNGHILINDWSSATSIGNAKAEQGGTFHFASPHFLDIQEVWDKKKSGVDMVYGPEDDLLSLVRVVCAQSQGYGDLWWVTDYPELRKFWNERLVGNIWDSVQAFARDKDYDSLYNGLASFLAP